MADRQARLAEKVARGGDPPPSASNLSRARSFQHRLCPIRRPSPKRVAPRPSLAVALATLNWNFKLAKEGREDTTMTRRAEQTTWNPVHMLAIQRPKSWSPVHTAKRGSGVQRLRLPQLLRSQAWQFKGQQLRHSIATSSRAQRLETSNSCNCFACGLGQAIGSLLGRLPASGENDP